MALGLEEPGSFVGAQARGGICFVGGGYAAAWIRRSPCSRQRETMVDLRCGGSAKCRFVVMLVVAVAWQVPSWDNGDVAVQPAGARLACFSLLLFFIILFPSVTAETQRAFVFLLQFLRVINGLRMLIPLYMCRLRNSVVLGLSLWEYPVTAGRLLGGSGAHEGLNWESLAFARIRNLPGTCIFVGKSL